MKFFLDTAIISEVERFVDLGVVEGITTNPTLIAQSGRDHHEVIKQLCSMIEGPVSAEVLSTNANEMVAEGKILAAIAENVVVKLPCTRDGFMACKQLSEKGTEIEVNMTLCFSVAQAMIAASCGAHYVSPFIGRLEDDGGDGIKLIHDIREAMDYSMHYTATIAASIRSQEHVERCAVEGADIATIPVAIMDQLFDHKLTTIGVAKFLADARTPRLL